VVGVVANFSWCCLPGRTSRLAAICVHINQNSRSRSRHLRHARFALRRKSSPAERNDFYKARCAGPSDLSRSTFCIQWLTTLLIESFTAQPETPAFMLAGASDWDARNFIQERSSVNSSRFRRVCLRLQEAPARGLISFSPDKLRPIATL
jgi:hypothetical protein